MTAIFPKTVLAAAWIAYFSLVYGKESAVLTVSSSSVVSSLVSWSTGTENGRILKASGKKEDKSWRGGALSSSSAAAIRIGLKNSVASGLAAACAKTILAPFDTLKTMQQKYPGTLGLMDATRLITARTNGFWELYAGLGVSALGSMPSVGLYFGVYSYSKARFIPYFQRTFADKERMGRSVAIALSAAIGNTVASFSRVPYEVVKQKLQTGQYATTRTAIFDMFHRRGGMRAFFPLGGVSIQMIRDIPYAILTLLSYETIREYCLHHQKTSNNPTSNGDEAVLSPWLDMMIGAIAGGIGSYLTNPMDVIKTRLQTDPHLYQGNIWNCIHRTYREGGLHIFLRGSIPRLLHKVPANGIFFVFYEQFQKLFQ